MYVFVYVYVCVSCMFDWAKRGKNDRLQVQKLRISSSPNTDMDSRHYNVTLTNYSAN